MIRKSIGRFEFLTTQPSGPVLSVGLRADTADSAETARIRRLDQLLFHSLIH